MGLPTNATREYKMGLPTNATLQGNFLPLELTTPADKTYATINFKMNGIFENVKLVTSGGYFNSNINFQVVFANYITKGLNRKIVYGDNGEQMMFTIKEFNTDSTNSAYHTYQSSKYPTSIGGIFNRGYNGTVKSPLYGYDIVEKYYENVYMLDDIYINDTIPTNIEDKKAVFHVEENTSSTTIKLWLYDPNVNNEYANIFLPLENRGLSYKFDMGINKLRDQDYDYSTPSTPWKNSAYKKLSAELVGKVLKISRVDNDLNVQEEDVLINSINTIRNDNKYGDYIASISIPDPDPDNHDREYLPIYIEVNVTRSYNNTTSLDTTTDMLTVNYTNSGTTTTKINSYFNAYIFKDSDLFDLEENLKFQENYNNNKTAEQLLNDNFNINENYNNSSLINQSLNDNFNLTEQYNNSKLINQSLNDTINITEQYNNSSGLIELLSETLRLQDSTQILSTNIIQEFFQEYLFLEQNVQLFTYKNILVLFNDLLILNESYNNNIDVKILYNDILKFLDDYNSVNLEDFLLFLNEVIKFNDSDLVIFNVGKIIEVLLHEYFIFQESNEMSKDVFNKYHEFLTFNNTLNTQKSSLLSFSENLKFVNLLSTNKVTQENFEEILLASCVLMLDGEMYECYSLFMENGAITRYDNYNFNSYCKFNENYYATSKDMLVKLFDNETNSEEDFKAVFKTGHVNVGNDEDLTNDNNNLRNKQKFLSFATFNLTSKGQILFSIINDKKEKYTYNLVYKNEDGKLEQTFGTKVRGNYFELELVTNDYLELQDYVIYPTILNKYNR